MSKVKYNSLVDILAITTPAEIDADGNIVTVLVEDEYMAAKLNSFNRLKNCVNKRKLPNRLMRAKKSLRNLPRDYQESFCEQLDYCYTYILNDLSNND